MKLRGITFDPITCEKCGKFKTLYSQELHVYSEGSDLLDKNLYGDRCKGCIYQDINRIYEVRERVMATRIDYLLGPEGVRLLPF